MNEDSFWKRWKAGKTEKMSDNVNRIDTPAIGLKSDWSDW